MNVYIMTDIEGISGTYASDQVNSNTARTAEGKRMFTRDVNIVAEACKKCGVEKVYVRDCHGASDSLMWESLSPAIDYAVCGMTGGERFVGLEDCDAVILLGYHAMAGTAYAALEHTMSGGAIQNVYLNDIKVGEIGIDSSIVGERGKPVIMVSGDDKACAEAKAFLPWTATAEVKKGVSRYGAVLLPPEKSKEVLENAVTAAIQAFNEGKMPPKEVKKPVVMRVERVERMENPLIDVRPYMTVIDGRSYEVTADSVAQALNRAM